MEISNDSAIKQLQDIISKWDDFSKARNEGTLKNREVAFQEVCTRMLSTIYRLAPPDSEYISKAELAKKLSPLDIMHGNTLAGILKALLADYEADYLSSIQELIHADIFSDFLEMADYLLSEGYKDAAAVIAGSVLEEHLRKLCDKNSITTKMPDGRPKKASALNDELARAGVYSKGDQKNVTAWLDIRNNAAHGKYGEYTKEQVALLIQSIRDFFTRKSA